MFCAYDSFVITAFEQVVADLRSITDFSTDHRLRMHRERLEELGFEPSPEFLQVLQAAKPRNYFGPCVSTLRVISRDSELCRKLAGSHLSEVLLNILSNYQLRRLATRDFLQAMNDHPDRDTPGVWLGSEALVAAMDHGLLKPGPIASVPEYIQLVNTAHALINSDEYKFPAPPFDLPEGWHWLTTGADFKRLGNYDSNDCLRQVEMHHKSFLAGTTFILRDANGNAWSLDRLPLSPT